MEDKMLLVQNILTVPMVSCQYIEYLVDYARFMSKNVFEIFKKVGKGVIVGDCILGMVVLKYYWVLLGNLLLLICFVRVFCKSRFSYEINDINGFQTIIFWGYIN